MIKMLTCPSCGAPVESYRNPVPTVDIIIYDPQQGVVLVKRRHEPLGYALPGGFVDEGETTEHAAVRETLEETHLNVHLTGLLGVYSDPARDPRQHTLSAVYIAQADNPGDVRGGDDAAEAAFCPLEALPPLVFDHERILTHFKAYLQGKRTVATLGD